MRFLSDSLKKIYNNDIIDINGKPVVIFRDHRWTLPVLYAAAQKGLLSLPATVVTFDRLRDLLEPRRGTSPLRQFREGGKGFDDLVELVRNHCSPRDDDWILCGMELGLIGDMVQFSASESYEDQPASDFIHADACGGKHRVVQLGRPARELSYKGGLVQEAGGEITGVLNRILGWDPSLTGVNAVSSGFLFDIDLDFFTIGWQNYTLPFPDEVFYGEFFLPCQSGYYDEYAPVTFVSDLVARASVITIATEPDFCGGNMKAKDILHAVDRFLFDGKLDSANIHVDYPPAYPHE